MEIKSFSINKNYFLIEYLQIVSVNIYRILFDSHFFLFNVDYKNYQQNLASLKINLNTPHIKKKLCLPILQLPPQNPLILHLAHNLTATPHTFIMQILSS